MNDLPVPAGSSGEDPIQLASEAPFQLGTLTVDPAMRRIVGADGTHHQIEPRAM